MVRKKMQRHDRKLSQGIRRKKKWRIFLLLILPAGMSLLWPGDLFWGGGDGTQTVFINRALQANFHHTLSQEGLTGSVGITYHPFAIWIYQFFLSVTNNLIVITFVKSIISISISTAGLFFLAKMLRYPYIFILPFFFSPYLYFYHRELTDDAWLVPFSLLLYVFYAWFYKRNTLLPLICITACTVVLFHLHLRGLIAVLPFASIFVLHHRWVKKNWRSVGVVLACGLLPCLPYLANLGQQIMQLSSPMNSAAQTVAPGFLSKFFPAIIGGSAFFSYYLPHPNPAIQIFSSFLGIGYICTGAGILITIITFIQKIRRSEALSLEDRLGLISLITVIVFPLILLVVNRHHSTEYYQGIWFAYLFFIWRAFITIKNQKIRNMVFSAYSIYMGLFWIVAVLSIHFGLLRIPFTLENMMEVAQKISCYSPESRIIQLADITDPFPIDAGPLRKGGTKSKIKANLQKLASESMATVLAYYQNSKVNFLHRALVPLLNIYYHNKNIQRLPLQTLVLTYNNENRIQVISDPAAVHRILLNQQRRRSSYPFLSNEPVADKEDAVAGAGQ